MGQITFGKAKPATRRSTAIVGMFVGLLAAAALATSAAPAEAVSASDLEKAHWVCIPPLPVTDELHCIKPRSLQQMFTGEARATTFLVFDASGEEYFGTEHNIRGDLFHGQPCPTDPPTYEYTYLGPIFGIDYWACHRFDSDHL
jgi:hypothetical protein